MMDTEIRFLQILEDDFLELAEADEMQTTARAKRRRSGTWIGAVAGIAVLAFGIGTLAGGGLLGQQARRAADASSLIGIEQGSQPRIPAALPAPPANPRALPVVGHQLAGAASATGAAVPDVSAPTPPLADLSKIVRNGSIALTIPDGSFNDRFARVIAIARAGGGFVLSSQTQGSSSGSLTLRVPSAAFDQTLVRLRALGVPTSSTVTGKDVTNQYVDYQAHLEVLQSRRAVLLRLMAKATTIGETIAVENELNDVQLQIDQIEGQLRFLDDQVAQATIDVQLLEQHARSAVVAPGDIQNPSLGRALQRAVQGFLAVLATVVVGLGYLVPVAVLAGIVLLIVMLVRRRDLGAT
jgi:hypothetical protein